MRYPFSYEVIITDAFNTSNDYLKECGMGLTESFTKAMKYIEDYYGKDLVAVKHLELFEECELIVLSPKVIEKYCKGEYSGIPCDANGNLIKNQEN